MARPKIDDREVKKVRAAVNRDGQHKAGRRFGENSPEFREAMAQRQRTQTSGQKQRARPRLGALRGRRRPGAHDD